MKYHGKLAGVLALVAVLFVGSLAPAADQSNADKIKELKKEIDTLKKEMEDMRLDREKHREYLAEVFRKLDQRLERIDSSLKQLTERGTRRSSSFTPGTGAAMPAATGTIRLNNTLAVPATVVLDGTVYTVPAFSVMTLAAQPARMITYEVTAVGYGVRAPVRTPVRPNETLTLTIY
jgi:hypothetical protein